MPRYSLWCEEKRCGDSGMMCQILDPNENYHPIPGATRPQLGCGVRVGSHYARSYQAQDWWQTSPVSEILYETDHMMKFKTRNSVYIWSVED